MGGAFVQSGKEGISHRRFPTVSICGRGNISNGQAFGAVQKNITKEENGVHAVGTQVQNPFLRCLRGGGAWKNVEECGTTKHDTESKNTHISPKK
jgi:hypothetical protein